MNIISLPAVGIDIGRSGIKLAYTTPDGAQETLPIIPAIACRSQLLTDHDERERAKHETVTLSNGEEWWYGNTAQIHGLSEPGIFSEWSKTDEYEALFLGAINELRRKGISGPIRLVGGLPSEATEQQRTEVAELFTSHLPEGSKVRILPQPAGAFFSVASNNPELSQPDVRVAVMDVGRYSTDYALIQGGRPVSGAFFSAEGVRFMVKQLGALVREKTQVEPPFERLERALREKKIVINTIPHAIEEQVASVCSDFGNVQLRKFQELTTRAKGAIDYVILAGGGGTFVQDTLSQTINITPVTHGRHSIAVGLMIVANRL